MRARRRSSISSNGDTSWPGFVDALSSLLLVIIFLLSMFVLGQFFLGQALSGRDQALAELRSQVSDLGGLLKMERSANASLRGAVGQLSSSLQNMTASKDALGHEAKTLVTKLQNHQEQLASLEKAKAKADKTLSDYIDRYGVSTTALNKELAVSDAARAEVARLQSDISSLKQHLSRLEYALETSEDRDKRQKAVIVNLGSRLNTALASKVEELAGYRSDFFARLKKVLSGRSGIRIEGDRFVFASELLFSSASADLGPEGRVELRKLAETLLEISREIPPNVKWILRIDGHTDSRPISNAKFKNNWELSAGRAISVVEFLILAGVPANRLAATGFGQHQPLDPKNTSKAYSRNRRIEMRLTDG